MTQKYDIPVISLRIVRDSSVSVDSDCIRSPCEIARILMERYGSLDREVLSVVHLDTKNIVLSIEPIAVGSLNCTHVSLRELFKGAILANSACIIMCHNHPSGDVTPSPEDIALAKTVREAAQMLDIKLLDSIIVSGLGFISMMEEGILSR